MATRSHLDELEAEAIYIIREVAAECEKPVMLYSIGKDSSVMLHLALKAFYPEKPPFPFLHIDTTWKFHEMIEFRDRVAKEQGIQMLVYTNEEGVKQGVNPFDYGSAYTDIMKTQALKQALNKYGFTAAFGGGRRDEEKSRAKERIFSFRNTAQAWDPKNQRPEMWKLYNTRIKKGESIHGVLFKGTPGAVSEADSVKLGVQPSRILEVTSSILSKKLTVSPLFGSSSLRLMAQKPSRR